MIEIIAELLDMIFVSIMTIARSVSEEDINKNLQFLKKQRWFQNFILNDRVLHLITHDQDVRKLIGKCSIKRMNGSLYEQIYENKFERLIKKKLAT